VVGLSIAEGFRVLIRLYRATIEVYENYIVLQKSYPDVWRLKPEAILRLGELLGHERFATFMRGLLMLEWIKDKVADFAKLPPNEQEEVVAKLREAVNLMETALNSIG
jgi:hypothetical protein